MSQQADVKTSSQTEVLFVGHPPGHPQHQSRTPQLISTTTGDIDMDGGLLPPPPTTPPITIHIEVCRKTKSIARDAVIKVLVSEFIREANLKFEDQIFHWFTNHLLVDNVYSISVDGFSDSNIQNLNMALGSGDGISHNLHQAVAMGVVELLVHVYQLSTDEPGAENLDEDDITATSHWILPSACFHSLWESLVYDSNLKQQLLNYVSTTLLFSDTGVDSNIISWNKVVLLHGPPGTGKTSLCKALAQKLSIQLSNRYQCVQLVEINSHSLFSKWFSESGKLVMKMFQKIGELIEDPTALVCVLIDEVESLTSARKSALAGTEPSDAIRVVNALLTQIDQLKRFPNVLILTTSNVTGAIDLAFVDRADIKQYIGLPTSPAIYSIYLSCIKELMSKNIISPKECVLDLRSLAFFSSNNETTSVRASFKLKEIASSTEGLSGRTIRKLPFLAHALFIQKPSMTLEEFLRGLQLAVEKQFKDISFLETN